MNLKISNIENVEVDYDNLIVSVDFYNESLQDNILVEFEIILDGVRVWSDSYGVEGSPEWIETNVADVYKLSLVDDEHEVGEDFINHLIKITVDEVESDVIDKELKNLCEVV